MPSPRFPSARASTARAFFCPTTALAVCFEANSCPEEFNSIAEFGFMEFNDAHKAVEYGAAHGALASTTPGDTSMATRKEVEKQISGGGARVVR